MPTPNITRLPEEPDSDWRKRYAKAYYQLNKDKWADATTRLDKDAVRERRRAYYQAKKETIKAKVAAYRVANIESCRLSAKRRYRAKKEDYKRRQKAYYAANKDRLDAAARKWCELNPESRKAIRSKWWNSNPDKTAAYWANRSARERQACPAWADIKEINRIYREARRRSKETGIEYHVDHIVPIAGRNVCGLHVHWNLRVIPAAENVRKSNRVTAEVLGLCHSILRSTSSPSP